MIAEFHFGSPVLERALSEAGARAVIESLDQLNEGRMRAVVWLYADEDGYERFESLVADADDVASSRLLATVDGARLYRIAFRAETGEARAYHAAVERDAVILEGESSGDGWWFRTRFPDRESFVSWLTTMEEEDVPIEVHALYSQESRDANANRYGITGPQREALLAAIDSGYFEVPRQASLADVAEKLDVSSQATSERLRRGVKAVLTEVLRNDRGVETDE